MSNVAGVISFKAKPGQGEEVARLIANALPHVEQEPGTLTWLVLRSDADPDLVFLVDLFADTASRNAHLSGEAAKQIFATVPPFLAEPPVVQPATITASKT